MGKMDREQMRLYLLEQQRQIDDFEPRINLEGLIFFKHIFKF